MHGSSLDVADNLNKPYVDFDEGLIKSEQQKLFSQEAKETVKILFGGRTTGRNTRDGIEDKEQNEYLKNCMAQEASSTSEGIFNSELPSQLTEMSKVNYQGHHSSEIESNHVNPPRAKGYGGMIANFNGDGIFDESFDLEEFMFGQNAFASLTAYSGQQTMNSQSSENILLNLNCIGNNSGGLISEASSIPNNSDQKLLERCLSDADQLFRTLSDPSEEAGHNLTSLNDSNPNIELNLLENVNETTEFSTSKPEESLAKGKDVNRRRDYSLSNDSGVEGCTMMDSKYPLYPKHPDMGQETSRRDESRNMIQNVDFSSDIRSKTSQDDVTSERQQFSLEGFRRDSHPGYMNSNNNNNNNNNNRAIDVQEHRYMSNDSDSRTESHDTDDGDVYGNKGYSPMQFCSSQLSMDNKNASKKTAYNEKWGVKVLKAWCVENQIATDFEKLSADQLNTLLTRFWAEVRKSNGDYYGRNSLFNLRAMINKHLKGKPHCVTFDIVTDERFRSSNERLEKQLKLLKGIGRTITHKQPISISDLRKMYDSAVLGTSNPLALLRKVWFEITLHFCHKGSESQEKLKKSSFDVYRDANGRRYVARTTITQNDGDEIRMYETGGELCPVKSYEHYTRKLHALQPRLFQQPRRKSTPDSPMWYGKAPIGEKALQQMMANISTAARLSKRYTNHCVRTTALEQFSNSRRKSGGSVRNDRSQEPSSASDYQSYKHQGQIPQLFQAPNNMYEAQTEGYQTGPSPQMRIPSLGQPGSLYHNQVIDGQMLMRNEMSNELHHYSNGTHYSGDDVNHLAGVRPPKRSYPSEAPPMYPPPAYGDHQFHPSSSPPSKRMRTNEVGDCYQRGYEGDLQDNQMFTLNDYENQQRQMHRLFAGNYEKRSYETGCARKSYSDDSGTGRSLLSPISVNTLSADNDNGNDLYVMHGVGGSLSETIVAGSTYDMVGTELNFGKRVQPTV